MLNNNVDLNNSCVLLTGAAGFIGSVTAKKLFEKYPDIKIVGIDNMNDYYDVSIKEYRLDEIDTLGKNWIFIKGSIAYYLIFTKNISRMLR